MLLEVCLALYDHMILHIFLIIEDNLLIALGL